MAKIVYEIDPEQLPDAEASFSRAQEKLKSSYTPERLPLFTGNLFHSFNSQPLIMFLEAMTGINGLIPDPYYVGAGVHKTLNGGHPDIHADFNLHKQMNLKRRLNVLIYLNRDWQEEWGGPFEIRDEAMTQKVASFVPTSNKMVCFSTSSNTFHGNPEPVIHPKDEPGLSIALHYYTATWDASRKAHTTLFKPRPRTRNTTDKLIARRQRVKVLMPPVIYRRIAHSLSRFGL